MSATNVYGTFDPTRQSRPRRPTSRGSAESADSSASIESRPLLPSKVPDEATGMMSSVSKDLIPFESIFHFVHRIFSRKPKLELPGNGIHEVKFSLVLHVPLLFYRILVTERVCQWRQHTPQIEAGHIS